jgi:hypothetical protein
MKPKNLKVIVTLIESRFIHFTPGTNVMIFKIFLYKKIAKKLAFFTQNKAKICEFLIIILRKTPIFCRKLAKIAENCDHNIDPSFVGLRASHGHPTT